jgi:hypothetical protein
MFLVLKKVVAFVEVVMVLEGKRRRRFRVAKKFVSNKKKKETRMKKNLPILVPSFLLVNVVIRYAGLAAQWWVVTMLSHCYSLYSRVGT